MRTRTELGVKLAKPKLSEALAALKLAAPFALGARWNDYHHCVEMSVSGAQVLKRFGVKADASLCAVSLRNFNDGVSASIGLTARQVHSRFDWGGAPQIPFEEWLRVCSYPDQFREMVAPLHCVIHVPSGRGFFLVDLTIGQLRGSNLDHFKTMPATLIIETPTKWPDAAHGDWELRYEAYPHDLASLKEARANMRRYAHVNDGLVDDLEDLMLLSLAVDNEFDRFTRTLYAAAPDMYKMARSNLHVAFGLP